MKVVDKIKKPLCSVKREIRLYKNCRKELEKAQEQVAWFKKHADITTLKPATGYLKKKQQDLVEFSQDFFEKIKELNIKPFLIAGNLLGQIRNERFIPWDDDMDFGLMRKDYNVLIDFFKKTYKYLEIDVCEKDYKEWVDQATKKYANQYVLFVYHNQIQISKGSSLIDRKAIDFFAFDYFKDDYSFEQHSTFLKEVSSELRDETLTIRDKYNIIKEKEKNYQYICDNSNHIYFGIDHMDSYKKSFNISWMDKSVILPLRHGVFEGHDYWIPNDSLSFIKYCYQDYKEFPADVGFTPHDYWKDYIYKNYITVEFYLCDAFEISHFLPFYKMLRMQGIYAIYIAEPIDTNVSGGWFDYDSAIKILEDIGAEYAEKCNPNAQYAMTTQDAYILGKYKHAKKINLSYGMGLNRNSFAYSDRTTNGFDVRLVHSEFQRQRLMPYMDENKIRIVGFPKHAGCNVEKFDRKKICRELGIDTDKRIIVYFPTWDEDSSIMLFGDAIQKLRAKFYVVTKLHHVLERREEKKKELKKVYTFSDKILESNYDFEKASILGDIAICDAKSGSSLEVPYINPNIGLVLLSVRYNLDEYFFEDIKSVAYVTNSPDDLTMLVQKAVDDKYRDNRAEKLEYYLGKKDENYIDPFIEDIKMGKYS